VHVEIKVHASQLSSRLLFVQPQASFCVIESDSRNHQKKHWPTDGCSPPVGVTLTARSCEFNALQYSAAKVFCGVSFTEISLAGIIRCNIVLKLLAALWEK